MKKENYEVIMASKKKLIYKSPINSKAFGNKLLLYFFFKRVKKQ